jgi:dTMP kinase
LSHLAGEVSARGITVVTTREPGGTALGNRLRAAFVEPGAAIDPIAEAFVVNASRAQHVAEVIEPALAAGAWVLCDRYADATLAYQGFGRGVDLQTLRTLAEISTRGRIPDLTLLIDVTVETSRERVTARSNANGEAIDRLEREDAAFHGRVRAGYLQLASDDARFVILDGSQPRAAVERAALATLVSRFAV